VNLLAFVLARLREPSTYAGAGAVLAAAGIHVPDATLNAAVSAIVAIAGLAAVLLPEAKHQPPAPPAAGADPQN
jgi:hypothetical protein